MSQKLRFLDTYHGPPLMGSQRWPQAKVLALSRMTRTNHSINHTAMRYTQHQIECAEKWNKQVGYFPAESKCTLEEEQAHSKNMTRMSTEAKVPVEITCQVVIPSPGLDPT